MIMTILKQTIRFHLDEKDYEIANIYADLYSKMILQYINQRSHAIAALKDLAYEFYIHELYRNAEKYYVLTEENYGNSALNDSDLLCFGHIQRKLNRLNQALTYYQRIVRYFPHSSYINEAYINISQIYDLCNNRNKALTYRSIANNFSKKNFKTEKQHKKSA